MEAEGIICIQDGADGLIVRTGIKQQVALNDVIEVVGFPSFKSYSPTLKDAVVRKTYESHSVSPEATSAASAETGKHDGRLVEMTGIVVLRQRLQKRVRGQAFDQWFLTLRDGEHSFTAELTDTLQEDDRRIAPVSEVRVIGAAMLSARSLPWVWSGHINCGCGPLRPRP